MTAPHAADEPPQRRQLRELTARFVRHEVLPHLDGWERAGLVQMATRTTAARSYVRHVAARVAAAGADATGNASGNAAGGAAGGAASGSLVTEVAMAKNVAVAACADVADRAVQLHGGYGYLRGSEVERHYRDARILGIGGGTTEIMNEIIAKGMGIQDMASSGMESGDGRPR